MRPASDIVPVRFGVVGPGRAARRFACGVAAVPGAQITAVWGRTTARAEAFAQEFAVPRACASFDELLALPDIDAVYIATHPDSHAELGCTVLAAGKHVFCEKPAALNERQVKQLVRTAHRHDRLFMEAMKPPFFPLYQRLRAHMAADPIGPVGYVRAGHAYGRLPADYPLHFPELGGGGILGIGPYEAFLALDWLGPLKRVQTIGRLSPRGVDAFAVFQSEHERGMAQLHTGIDLESMGDALLSGPRGYVLIRANWWNPVHASVHYSDSRVVELDEPFEAGGFNYETAHFCELVRAGLHESPEITHALSLGMARLLQRARRALGVRLPGE